MTEMKVDGQVRVCGYSECGNTFPYSGQGRPQQYCTPGGKPRRWPELGNRTCKQLAAEERAATRHAGLEEVLAAYADSEDPVLEAISGLAAALAERGAQGERVLQAVDGRVEQAERLAAEAAARAQVAETERERAVRQAETDRRERESALEAKLAAEKRARDAEAERRRDVEDAWDKVGDARRAHAAAEERTTAAHATAANALAERDKESVRVAELAAAVKELTTTNKELTKANRDLAEAAATAKGEAATATARAEGAEAARATATAAVEQAHIDLRNLRTTLDGQITDLRAQSERAEERAAGERAERVALAEQVTALRAELEAQRKA